MIPRRQAGSSEPEIITVSFYEPRPLQKAGGVFFIRISTFSSIHIQSKTFIITNHRPGEISSIILPWEVWLKHRKIRREIFLRVRVLLPDW